MKPISTQLVEAAADSFPMPGPVYEFGFSPMHLAQQAPHPCPNNAPNDDPMRVERLEDLDRLPFDDYAARTVVCENAMQYVFDPQLAMDEMLRILAPGGLIVVVESARRPTGAGGDRYWTVHPGAIGRLLGPLDATLIGWIGHESAAHTVFGIGCKEPLPAEFAAGVQPFIDRIEHVLGISARRLGRLRALKRRLIQWLSTPAERRALHDEHRVHYALHLPVDAQTRPAILSGCLPKTKTGTRLDLSE